MSKKKNNLEDQSSESKKKIIPHHDHGHPTKLSRRDFIAQGLMTGFSVSMIPSTLMSLLKPSFAEAAFTCPSSAAAPGLIPLIVLDMAGGLALPGNFMVGGKLGAQDYLPSYSTLGIPDANNPKNISGQVDTRFGAPMHSVLSKFYSGMMDNMTADTQAKSRIMTVCHSAQDDTSNNPLSPLFLASRAGLLGSILPNGLGTSSSQSGGNSIATNVDPSLKPLPVTSSKNLVTTLSYGEALSKLTIDQKVKIAKAASSLSQGQLSKFQNMTQGEQFANLSSCGYVKGADLVSNIDAFDASKNINVQSVYKTDAGNGQAAVVYNALMGNTGPGAIVIGGCDYHQRGQDETDAKDYEAGAALGRALELANKLGKPAVVVGITDGGCSSTSNTRLWSSDSGSRSLSFVACMLPNGAPNLIQSQIGSYTTGQAADSTLFFSKNSSMISYVLMANYLKICNRMDLFSSIVPVGAFPLDKVNEVLGFG